MSRENNIQHITKNIKVLSDGIVTDVYNTVWQLCEDDGDKKGSRIQKIKYIVAQLDLISDDDLINIKQTIDDANKYVKMYNALLDVLNKILEHNEMELITDITQFKNITRDLIANEECNKIVLDNFKELINVGFEKKTEGFQCNKYLIYANLNIIKCVCAQLGYKLSSVKKSKMKNKVRKISTYYSIEKL